jgi:translation initiation factor 1
MSKKNIADKIGFVYSTDPNFQFNRAEDESVETLDPVKQPLIISLDKKQRGGKTVTLISGFIGQFEDLEQLSKQLKNFCGTGGSAKDGEAIVQGDQRDKVLLWLHKNGYTKSKKK